MVNESDEVLLDLGACIGVLVTLALIVALAIAYRQGITARCFPRTRSCLSCLDWRRWKKSRMPPKADEENAIDHAPAADGFQAPPPAYNSSPPGRPSEVVRSTEPSLEQAQPPARTTPGRPLEVVRPTQQSGPIRSAGPTQSSRERSPPPGASP